MPALTAQQSQSFASLVESLAPGLALALSEQINQEVLLDSPDIQTVSVAQMMSAGETSLYTVFTLPPPLDADSVVLVSDATARLFADLIAGGDGQTAPETLEESHLPGLQSAMAGLARGLATSLANLVGKPVEVESCATTAGTLSLPPSFALSAQASQIRLPMTISGVADSELTLLLTQEWAAALTEMMDDNAGDSDAATGDSVLSEDELAAMLSNMGGDSGFVSSSPAPSASGFSGVGSSATPPPFANFPTGDFAMPRGIDLILDIPLEVTVELGRVRMLIKDVLELSSGSIIELDRVAGEPVDLLVNGRLIAKGEVVVIEDNFGIRLTEILSPAERVSGLGKGR